MNASIYNRLSPNLVVKVIKAGTFCRTMWPLFAPLIFYKYLREVDKEMLTTELFYDRSGSTAPLEFYDPSRPGWLGHWHIMEDLKKIYHEANPGRVKTYVDAVTEDAA